MPFIHLTHFKFAIDLICSEIGVKYGFIYVFPKFKLDLCLQIPASGLQGNPSGIKIDKERDLGY